MKLRSFYLLAVLLLASALGRTASAQIRANISFGYPPRAYYGPRYYGPRYYVSRPPILYAVPPPPPVYYAPRPVYYAPAPVYYAPRPYYGRGYGRRW